MSLTPSGPALRVPAVKGVILLFSAWIVTRGVLLAQTLGGDAPLDVAAYARWATLLRFGGSPASDTAFVYPPGSNLVFISLSLVSPASAYRAFTMLAVLMDFLVLLCLVLFARRTRSTSLISPWAWVVMGFAVGPLIYERFDVFAALLGCIAVLSISRPMLSGGFAGLGFLVKLWPEIALLGLPRARLMRGIIANVVVVAVGWTSLHVIFGDSFGFITNVMNKGLSVEAVAAYPFLALRALVGSHGVTGQFGSWEVTGPGVALAATATTAIGVILLAGILVLRIAGRLEEASPGDVVLLGVLIFIATHKINSLQYGVWIAAMTAAALAYSSSRARGPAVLLTLSLVVANEVIWTHFVPFISGNPILIAFQGLRLVLLLAATVWLAVEILRSRSVNSAPSLA